MPRGKAYGRGYIIPGTAKVKVHMICFSIIKSSTTINLQVNLSMTAESVYYTNKLHKLRREPKKIRGCGVGFRTRRKKSLSEAWSSDVAPFDPLCTPLVGFWYNPAFQIFTPNVCSRLEYLHQPKLPSAKRLSYKTRNIWIANPTCHWFLCVLKVCSVGVT